MAQVPIGRRTNAERSSDTRNRILQAAVGCLIEDGYAATSVAAIQSRAGVSRGALLHQYPSKAELLVDAVRHIAAEQTAPGLTVAPRGEASAGPPMTMDWFDELWRHFTTPVFGAVLELWVAARTDPGLRNSLLPYEQKLGRTLRQIALGGAETAPPRFNEVFELTLTYFRGLALTDILSGPEHLEHLLQAWRRAVAAMLRDRDRDEDGDAPA